MEGKQLAPDFVGATEVNGRRAQSHFVVFLTGFTNPGIVARYDFDEPGEDKCWSIYRSTIMERLVPDEFSAEQVWQLSLPVVRMSNHRLGLRRLPLPHIRAQLHMTERYYNHRPHLVLPHPPSSTWTSDLQSGDVSGVSIQQQGSFFGFSIEFGVTTQVLGLNSSFLQVPFLNLMANLRQRGGSVRVRVGGNTQETATLVASTPDGAALEKDYAGIANPTATLPLVFATEIIKMMAEISALTNVYCVPFNDTQHWRLQIAEVGEAMLGNYLIGLQGGNEPDLYSRHGHRPDVSPQDYKDEFGLLIDAMNADSNIPNKDLLIGPNLAGMWSPTDIWETGFATDFNQNLAALGVERYPTDNCDAQFGIGTPRTGPEMLPTFLTHQAGKTIVPWLSDSFRAALWGIDYALQLAYSNFSTVLFHVGGQSVYYNPFTRSY
ncbi:uncharacterized protein HD556DRAFT_1485636 [Suillus plorans]|uniref:Glycoside hydrolase family 79 protein n=1 Tax=Suillus plorans TaxID=116603 RepID=A0A9P7ALZ8_9AGAM|nr:uncharacterized protein HD556DRAFT_1507473 [Suillus plorans]XP_041158322.1 uncharacterized protein HD556DRAFT_1485636 [Suillus plorans]KAG1786339.1 hypothetical protein HD556DRAFT_1507473 [Suillus plorans]KAG1791516.1 hypothetical protein HD556DRAFT_1485636 [Suillus plorans]